MKMNRVYTYGKLTLGFFIIALMLAGCRSKVAFGVNRGQIQSTESVIESIIAEPERRDALLQIVDDYKEGVGVIEKEVMILRQEIVELNADYDTPREELEARYSRLGELTEQFGQIAKKYSLKARALCSEDEWKRIAPKKIKPFSFKF